MSKDTNPAPAEHTAPKAPAAPVSQAVQIILPAQAAVQIPQFTFLAQEARYLILQFMSAKLWDASYLLFMTVTCPYPERESVNKETCHETYQDKP